MYDAHHNCVLGKNGINCTQHQEWPDGLACQPSENHGGCDRASDAGSKTIMYIQKLFANKLKGITYPDIARQLGYQNADNCASKIKKLLSSPYLGLEESAYDFKYSTDEFIVKLAQLLDIPSLVVEKVIEEIQAELLRQAQKFRSYIFVETFFRREGQPVFVLVVMEGLRRINISEQIRRLSLDQQLPEVQSLIRYHYRGTNGQMPVWGTIARYVFYYENDLVIEFSPTGKIINASRKYQALRAELSIGGKPIDFPGKPTPSGQP